MKKGTIIILVILFGIFVNAVAVLSDSDTSPPSTPTNLTATAISSSQINLSWTASTDNVGVAGYYIYRDGNQIDSTVNTSYFDTGLTASTTYTYTVSAYDLAGNESSQSSLAQATTLLFTGNELHVGEGQEYLTIQSAIEDVQAGDKILLHPGVYDESLIINKNDFIIKSADPTQKAILNQDIVLDTGSYITIKDLYMNGSDIRIISGHHNKIISNYFYKVGIKSGWQNYCAISVTGDSNLISNNTIYKPQMGLCVSGTNNTIENNEINGLKQWISTDCDYSRVFGRGNLIRNNYFHNGRSPETGSAHVDCFQTFDNNGEFLKDTVIENNFCSDMDEALMFEAYYHKNDSNITIRNNVFTHSGNGIMAGPVDGIKGLYIYNNIFTELSYGAIIASMADCKNNIFYNINFISGNAAYTCASGSNNLIFSEVFRYYSETKRENDIMGFDPEFNPKFINTPKYYSYTAENPKGSGYDGDESHFAVPSSYEYLYTVGEYVEYCPGGACDGVKRQIISKSGNIIGFSPSILNYSTPVCGEIYEDYCNIQIRLWGKNGDDWNFNFNLEPTSPAIDTGTNLAGVVDYDIVGTPRPQGSAWDIGAYEYVPPPSADTTPPSPPTGVVVE